MRRRFFTADVFTDRIFGGNPVAVFPDGTGVAGAQMQRVARELNLSETVFVLPAESSDNTRRLRIFTPRQEIDFAGHPTLGTAFAIQQEILREPVETLALNLKIGQIPVRFTYQGTEPDLLWMRQINPEFGQTLAPADVAPVLGLDPGDIDDRFPIQEVGERANGHAFWRSLVISSIPPARGVCAARGTRSHGGRSGRQALH